MNLILEENIKERLFLEQNCIRISVRKYESLEYNNIIGNLIDSDELFNKIKMSVELKSHIYDCIIEKIDFEELKEILQNNRLCFAIITMVSIVISKYSLCYKRLNNVNRIIIKCSESNLLNALLFSKTIKEKEIILDCSTISAIEFYGLLKNINIDDYENSNIKICPKHSSNLIDLYRYFLIGKHLTQSTMEAIAKCRKTEAAHKKNDYTEIGDYKLKPVEEESIPSDFIRTTTIYPSKKTRHRSLLGERKFKIVS